MDGIVETSDNYKRQRVSEEQVEDRISSLPESLLIHILSFLPTQDAVRTVLVPRFRHLWQFLPSLTFDQYWGDGPFNHENFLDFVRHVLICHQNATIEKFVLKLHFSFKYSVLAAASPSFEEFANKEKRMASEVDSWVYFAMRKKAKVLHLDFMPQLVPEPGKSCRLPSVVFRGENLAELKLVSCEIKPSGQIQLNCLKRLFLEETFLNDKILNQILGGCSVLEELSLICCYGLSRLGFRNSSIKSLTVSYPFNYWERLEISCPNSESLDISGDLEFVDLVDVSSVVVSTTFFDCFQCSPGLYKMVEAFFKNLGHCKVFSTCDSCIMLFSKWQLKNRPGLQFGWKCLEFEVGLTKWHLPGISCLLRSSPYLETLAMSIHPQNDETFRLAGCLWMKPYDFDGGQFWRSQEGTFRSLKCNLKTIKISGDIAQPCVIDITEFLLKNAMVLGKLGISTHKYFQPSFKTCCCRPNVEFTPKQRVEFPQKPFGLPRASTNAVNHFA